MMNISAIKIRILLKYSAVILVTPYENLSDGTQGFHK